MSRRRVKIELNIRDLNINAAKQQNHNAPQSSLPMCSKDNAYVILVMGNPHYVIGALATAYSIKLTETKHKVVCMATPDIYGAYADVLGSVYDEVIPTRYLAYQSGKLFSIKQEEIYKEWANISFTKWQCLRLNKYNKICLLDADLIVSRNIDHLFDMRAPAGCFVNYWKNDQINYYAGLKFGDIIPNTTIKKGLNSGFVANGHCITLEPSARSYKRFIKFMNSGRYKKNPGCLSMVDEVAIVKFQLEEGKVWSQLTEAYNCVPWKNENKNPYIWHYFNKKKPWLMDRKEWSDLSIWYTVWDKLCLYNPQCSKTLAVCKP